MQYVIWVPATCVSIAVADWFGYRFDMPDDAMFFTSNDACLLIQKLEEIHLRVAQGSGDDYLTVLSRVVKGGEKHALQRLQAVRLSLARYYARCGAIGVGGRPSGWYH